jgi:ABC-type nickel/cobalt efflux system permease component RcnA
VTIRQWVGGALLLLSGIWSVLLLRDYYLSVMAPEVTESSVILFYQTLTSVSTILAALAMGLGFTLLMVGRKSRAKKHSHHHHSHRHHRSKSGAASLPVGVPWAVPVSPNGEADSPDHSDHSPGAKQADSPDHREHTPDEEQADSPVHDNNAPGGEQADRSRSWRRIRVRVRKKKKK